MSEINMLQQLIPPRLIRLRDAPSYLGMERRCFKKNVRPLLTVLKIGKQGIAFDRLDLDKWVDYYKNRSERPANKRLELWDAKKRQDSTDVEITGISTNKFADKEFAKALELLRSKKRKST